jgi:hypothetical protein
MIDREFRDKAALALRRFLDCSTDNNDCQLEYPGQSLFGRKRPDDPALRAIEEYVWHWYDDLSLHKLEKDRALSDDERERGERCILFLKSDLEYEWRQSRFIPGDFVSLEFASQLTLSEHMALSLDQPEGDGTAWPFFRRSDFELAVKSTIPK